MYMYTMLVALEKKSDKVDYRVQASPDLARRADALFDSVGQKRTEAIGRVLEWLLCPTDDSKLNDRIQRQILGVLSPDMQVDIARIQLERMASEPAEGPDPAAKAREHHTQAVQAASPPKRKRAGH